MAAEMAAAEIKLIKNKLEKFRRQIMTKSLTSQIWLSKVSLATMVISPAHNAVSQMHSKCLAELWFNAIGPVL